MRKLNFRDDYLQIDKSKDRDEIARQVEAFLASGGKPEVIDSGISGEKALTLSPKERQTMGAPNGKRKVKHHFYPSLTITEFAEQLGMTPAGVHYYVAHGKLEATPASKYTPRLIRIEEQVRFKQWLEEK